jgi:hypothetical protein
MDILLFIVIVLQTAFLVYSDIQNRKERERLQLKLMAKDLNEYVSATEEAETPTEEEEDPYIEPNEATFEQILNAKEKQ